MADTRRVIQLVTSARLHRTVEAYRATIRIRVVARRSKSALTESVALRERVIAALRQAGIEPGNIEEGGGEVRASFWSSSKVVVHELRVTHPEMRTLVEGMANVENVFVGIKNTWFSGISRTFSFTVPTATFADDATAIDKALTDAVRRTQARAAALAQGAGVQLGPLISIAEYSPGKKQRSLSLVDDDVAFDEDGLDDMDLTAATVRRKSYDYTPASPTQSTKSARFRICFEVKENS